ncbi:MAG: hypothetical protein LBE34_15440 [Flavobacteriaceae bacterium]|jgi:hypothetical protein|nr:hypothetical protein [Flavobacteriaceae bacterium]
MIVWSGRGIFSVIFLVAGFVLGMLVFPKEWNSDLPFIFAFMLAGLVTWFLGSKWNEERIVFHEVEQQYYRYKNNHTLFWIPMQYIGLLFSAAAVTIIYQSSWVWGIVSGVLLLFVVCLKFLKNSNIFTKKDKAQVVSKQEVREDVVKEESNLERKIEKEDPSRFMPK